MFCNISTCFLGFTKTFFIKKGLVMGSPGISSNPFHNICIFDALFFFRTIHKTKFCDCSTNLRFDATYKDLSFLKKGICLELSYPLRNKAFEYFTFLNLAPLTILGLFSNIVYWHLFSLNQSIDDPWSSYASCLSFTKERGLARRPPHYSVFMHHKLFYIKKLK